MSQPLSIENKEHVYLITTRTAGSRLWFIKNKALEEKILGALARYQEKYQVKIYSFILMGNHYHLIAQFPNCNRARFMRDFNSMVARLVGRYVKLHGRCAVWARRYSYQVIPREIDIWHWFFYVALNPISSGITKSIGEYPAYNSIYDAMNGVVRTYKWIDWSKYLLKKRYKKNVSPDEFVVEHKLVYSRLPGHEELSQETHRDQIVEEIQTRTSQLVQERVDLGKGFLGPKLLSKQQIGAKPKTTKISTRYSYRPLVLTLCMETKNKFLQAYFNILDSFIIASKKYRQGDLSADFPCGTYPPPILSPVPSI